MNKKLIRLTESDLHRIVKESVNEILNEIGGTPNGNFVLNAIRGRRAAKRYRTNMGLKDRADKIFNGDDVDQKPSFPGGNKALNKFIASNLRYPDMARMLDKQGTIIVKFVVNETGVLTDIKLAKDSYSLSLGKESLRVVKAMPKWYPGLKNGKAVKVKWSIPITFRL